MSTGHGMEAMLVDMHSVVHAHSWLYTPECLAIGQLGSG